VNRFTLFLTVIIFVGIFTPFSLGQALYSYLDENGVQHFTNVAPVKQVWNLKITGSEPAIAVPDVPKTKTDQFAFSLVDG
jgi:hypothetical protein